jgi:hypothetical protein
MMINLKNRLKTWASRRVSDRRERGQIVLFIALGFVGLIAFIGLATDIGILFISMGHLRRGVDSAALAASAQFREGRDINDITAAAHEFLQLNQGPLVSTTVTVETCETTPGLCPGPQRKFVRVVGSADVPFAFLPIIGWNGITINADAVSEAASLDIVLVLDTSESMAYDADCHDGDDDDGDGVADDCEGSQVGAHPDDYYRDPTICNTDPLGLDGGDGFLGECHPFEEVKQAAMAFVQSLYYPYDRVAVVRFALDTSLEFPLQTTADAAAAAAAINNLQVSDAPEPGVNPCTWSAPGDDPSGCTSTSIGGGLQGAAAAFVQPLGGANNIRDEALWVTILLTDGAANASVTDPNDANNLNVHCPDSTWWPQPFCRDASASTRHSILAGGKLNPNNSHDPDDYDADDFARDMADLVACPGSNPPANSWCTDSLNYAADDGGQNALIFSIGLGDAVTNNAFGDANAGEVMLRYAANVGTDGEPDPNHPNFPTDPCLGRPTGQSCGNYFFSPSGGDLLRIFEEIASRIFTRLTE